MYILALLFLSWIEIPGVPFIRQEDQFCGPAALASVFKFNGLEIDQKSIGKIVYNSKLRGAMITDLENYAKTQGFKTHLRKGDIKDITEVIDRGQPAIALIDNGVWLWMIPHYVIIYGHDKDRLLMHTGYNSSVWLRKDVFQKKWHKMGSVYLIILKNPE